MKKLLLGTLITAALLTNVMPASADGLYYLGNTANDSSVPGFVSMVKDPSNNAVNFVTGTTFWSNNVATTKYPTSSVTDPNLASTFSMPGSSYFEATGLTDPEPIATTQVTAATLDGTVGSALAQAVFFQTFNLTTNGVYTYDFLTGITGSYFAFDPNGVVSGYSKAKYALGWWDPTTSGFVAGQFIESGFYEVPIGQSDVNAGLYGQLTWDFSNAPTGALPAFSAYSESYAQVVPIPPTLLLLGSGLMGLAGWRRFRKS
jgi:hypothetical protein